MIPAMSSLHRHHIGLVPARAEGVDPDNGVGRKGCGPESFARSLFFIHRYGVFEIDNDSVRAGRSRLEIPVRPRGRNEQGRKKADALAAIGHEKLRLVMRGGASTYEK
jgi:hypothetical protein